MAAETYVVDIKAQFDDQTDPSVTQASQKIDKFEASIKRTQKEIDRLTREKKRVDLDSASVDRAEQSIQRTRSELNDWLREKKQLLLDVKDKATGVIKSVISMGGGLMGKTWSLTLKAIDLVTAPVRGIFDLLKNPILQAGAILGVSVGLKDTIDTFVEFEATMSKVRAVGELTAEELAPLTQRARELGEATKFTATEVGQGMM
jgi:hypothetical protein